MTLAGFMLSGPLGLVAVMLRCPQPTWQSAQVFAEHFNRVQTLPFFASFLQAIGYPILLAALYRMADE